jgi:hypothetical protein
MKFRDHVNLSKPIFQFFKYKFRDQTCLEDQSFSEPSPTDTYFHHFFKYNSYPIGNYQNLIFSSLNTNSETRLVWKTSKLRTLPYGDSLEQNL